jgi:hypothetical protein
MLFFTSLDEDHPYDPEKLLPHSLVAVYAGTQYRHCALPGLDQSSQQLVAAEMYSTMAAPTVHSCARYASKCLVQDNVHADTADM